MPLRQRPMYHGGRRIRCGSHPNGIYWSVGTSTFIAIYTFNLDGSGSMEGINRIMSLPGGYTRIEDEDVPNDKPMGVVMDPMHSSSRIP